eukprot:CAMPEP_0184492934 /NCGR_PEP_ID=MMETSP0113_2-20130426/24649_1 /TAXON_ID=91329 /ORGANISM="Norrisiella sphaerica, Strain BC52" /LENGTH=477 /DNA_ID=CAMNT_0026877987 /DNA_START=310 /DNA_END=1743 /DNA_ORIENTATION=+
MELEADMEASESGSRKVGASRIAARPVDGSNFRYSEQAQYIGSIRAWSLEWIEYIPTNITVRVFHEVRLLKGPRGAFGVWMLLRTGEGRGARSVVYLLDFNTHNVGWVDVSAVGICGSKCTSLQVSEMQDWQSKIKRKPFAPAKIKANLYARGTRYRGASKRFRNTMFELPDRPLRRSRRQENTLTQFDSDNQFLPRIYELEIQKLQNRVRDLETHNMSLVDHNSHLQARLVAGDFQMKMESASLHVIGSSRTGDNLGATTSTKESKASLESETKSRDGSSLSLAGAPTASSKGRMTSSKMGLFFPSVGSGEMQLVEAPPQSVAQRVMCWEVGLLAVIVSFLDIRERSKISRVCSLWSTPLLNHSITKIDFIDVGTKVTDQIVLSVASRHTEVETLCLEHCEKISDDAICDLAEHYGKELSYVNVGYCPLLTDKAVQGLERCRNLKTLIIHGCPNVTPQAIRQIAGSLRNLITYPEY